MATIEERVRKIVEANWGDQQALIHAIVREMQMLHAALPSAADLEAIAHHFETACGQEVDLPDGTTFDASVFLRRTARLIRLAINEELEPEDESTTSAAHG
jgi:hypothetical protein